MFKKIADRLRSRKFSMRMKLFLSLSAIAVSLLVSSFISIMEYTKMSDYVSDLIAANIKSINLTQELSLAGNSCNLEILAVVGDTTFVLPSIDHQKFEAGCDSLRKSLSESKMLPLADTVAQACASYLRTARDLDEVVLSDFIDTRAWYFDKLQPEFGKLTGSIDALNTAMYEDLMKNSATFERGFYRSIIPGVVAVGVGLLLVLMLLFFILAYYVNPIYKMLSGLDSYRSYGKTYSYTFEGDDQLSELNRGIIEITGENRQLRKRIAGLKNKLANFEKPE